MIKLSDELIYWKTNEDWYHFDSDTGGLVVNDDAPQKAKDSYNKYRQKIEEICRREKELGIRIM